MIILTANRNREMLQSRQIWSTRNPLFLYSEADGRKECCYEALDDSR